jgi:aldehyde dehydrogenase (NAD+)
MAETYSNYVDGEWRESATGETVEVYNPANTDDVTGNYQRSSADDAAGAIEAAAAAADEWANTPGTERGAILRGAARRLDDRSEEATELMIREEGKARPEASGEVGRAVNVFYYYAEKARDIGGESKQASATDANLYTVREPMGVAGLVAPWNYPIAIPAWKAAPALASGNSIVLKPAGIAPGTARIIFECLDDAGIPAGVANFVTGPGSEVGTEVVTNDAVDCVSFTGSRSVGETVYDQATDGGKRIQTELGSKNLSVVMPSADVEEAVETVAGGAFGVTGQACTSTDRAIVHESVAEEFTEKLVAYAEDVDVGPGLEGHEMGPQASRDELEGTLEYVEIGRNEGATLETGGTELDGEPYDNGHFVDPAVFSGVESDMRIAQEEVFGPFVGVVSVSDFDEAIEVTNDVEFGLSAGICTHDHTEANRFIDEADFGVIKVNEATTGLDLHVPFGGMNASSSETYREQGDAGIDFFTITKTVYENY